MIFATFQTAMPSPIDTPETTSWTLLFIQDNNCYLNIASCHLVKKLFDSSNLQQPSFRNKVLRAIKLYVKRNNDEWTTSKSPDLFLMSDGIKKPTIHCSEISLTKYDNITVLAQYHPRNQPLKFCSRIIPKAWILDRKKNDHSNFNEYN